jgi:hypothetical protein
LHGETVLHVCNGCKRFAEASASLINAAICIVCLFD